MTPMNRLSRLPTSVSRNRNVAAGPSYAVAAVVAAGALAAAALLNRHLAKKAEHDNPPAGQFLDVDGVRLHYVERGSGEPLVLLHGNGSMIQDFESSGLVDLAAKNYRVIIIDRPGFGHSSRPRNVIWTPDAQAQLIQRALTRLGVSQAIVLGHSWGASVAAALALKFPNFVRGLVLASGYYYPTLRPDVVAMSAPAIPVVGDIMGHTVSPMISRLMWPLMMAKIFGPKSAPSKFERFPKEMALRPSQIRSSAAESALMIPDAFHFDDKYGELKMPVVIIAGEDDRLIDIDKQSARSFRHLSECVSPLCSKRPHDPSDSDGPGDGGDQRSSRQKFLGHNHFTKYFRDFSMAVRFGKTAALRQTVGTKSDSATILISAVTEPTVTGGDSLRTKRWSGKGWYSQAHDFSCEIAVNRLAVS
jgi:pimeloyl-ACP methyl ester carboxylesterase